MECLHMLVTYFILLITLVSVNAEKGIQCSNGLIFDHKLQKCVSPFAPECPADQDTDLYFPHEEHCDKFYVCFMGILTTQTCPDGLEFNPDKNECDWPTPDGCYSKTTTEKPTEPTTPTPPKCPSDSTDLVVIPHESECTMFYICYNGESTEHQCIDGMEFNSKLSECVPIGECGCTAEKNPTSPPSSSSDVCEGLDGFIAHPTDCTKFYFCFLELPILLHCSPGREYDPELEECHPISATGCTAKKGCLI